jgi:hypothetical protein
MENLEPMNYFEARVILDGIKDNLSYNLDTINKALELTGDLDIAKSEREASPASCRYGSKAWLDSLCQGKGAGA